MLLSSIIEFRGGSRAPGGTQTPQTPAPKEPPPPVLRSRQKIKNLPGSHLRGGLGDPDPGSTPEGPPPDLPVFFSVCDWIVKRVTVAVKRCLTSDLRPLHRVFRYWPLHRVFRYWP